MTDLSKNNWLLNTIIYQLFVGRWQNANLIDHHHQVFKRLASTDYSKLKALGIDTLYLLGLFNNCGPIVVSEEGGKDLSDQELRIPSPFALTDHTQPNPLLGSESDLVELIKTLHSHQFKVIIDFIPNHTSLFHPWTKSHPEYYHHQDGQKVAEFSKDVYKLNYENPQLREAMLSVLTTIQSWGVDGVRVDMAHLIPSDFWHQAIPKLKIINSQFIFIAEAYPESLFDLTPLHQLLQAGFDAIYHEPLYRNLSQAIHHHQPLSFVTEHLNYINQQSFSSTLVNYIANHDDSLLSSQHTEALLSLIIFLPGIPFLYNGLLNNLPNRLAHHYFESLPNNFNELNTIPPAVSKVLEYRKQNSPTLIKIELLDTKLISLTVKVISGSTATIFINLTPSDQALPTLESAGLIHQLSSGQILPMGQTEIFSTDPT